MKRKFPQTCEQDKISKVEKEWKNNRIIFSGFD